MGSESVYREAMIVALRANGYPVEREKRPSKCAFVEKSWEGSVPT
jgi:hypothetical protein